VTKRDEPHTPGRPSSPEPPAELLAARDSLSVTGVTRVGLTTTADGEWGLIVRVPQGTSTPIAAVEAASHGFPVIYQVEPERLPVARPAYPGRGE
jgi:hypothetical protein